MYFIHFNGVNFPVMVDVASFEVFKNAGLENQAVAVLHGGGIATGFIDRKRMKEMLAGSVISEREAKLVEENDVTYVISVIEEVKNALTEKELMMILHHEAGHILNGDLLKKVEGKVSVGGYEIKDDEDAEIAADKFAAIYYEKADIANAVLKCAKICIEFLEKLGKIPSSNDKSWKVEKVFKASRRYAALCS